MYYINISNKYLSPFYIYSVANLLKKVDIKLCILKNKRSLSSAFGFLLLLIRALFKASKNITIPNLMKICNDICNKITIKPIVKYNFRVQSSITINIILRKIYGRYCSNSNIYKLLFKKNSILALIKVSDNKMEGKYQESLNLNTELKKISENKTPVNYKKILRNVNEFGPKSFTKNYLKKNTDLVQKFGIFL